MRKSSWLYTILLLSTLILPAMAGESLVYCVTYKGQAFTTLKTEISEADAETGTSRLLFSDEHTPIQIIERPYAFHWPVSAANHLFAHAMMRDKSPDFPGNADLYELSSDGSNRFRKVAPIAPIDESLGDIFVNPAGTRIGYLARKKEKQYLFVHDAASGALLRQTDVTHIFLDCFASAIGWLRDGRMFLSLETGDDDVTSEESYHRVGSYVMDEDGQHLTKLPKLQALEGFLPPTVNRVIGALPKGELLVETVQQKVGAQPRREQPLIADVAIDPGTWRIGTVGFRTSKLEGSGIRLSYTLSPSGRYMGVAQVVSGSKDTSWPVWIRDLQTNSERQVLTIPIKGMDGPFVGVVGWN
jgi:hypothetical protein